MEWLSSDESSDDEMPAKRKRGHVVPLEIRWAMIGSLKTMFNTVKPDALAHGAHTIVAKQFDVHQSMVSKLWKRYEEQRADGDVPDLAAEVADRGRKLKLDDFLINREAEASCISALPGS